MLRKFCRTANGLRRVMNLWPPLFFSGIQIMEMSEDYRYMKARLRNWPLTRNLHGAQFGGSLFAMTDPFWMLMLLQNLGRDYYVWDKAGEIEFVKPGKGVVATEFRLDDALLDEVRKAAAGGDKHLRWFSNEITDANGDVVARVRKQVYVRLKPEAR